MIQPDELTGEMVKTIRTKHKITREAFKDRCVQGGLNWGKSVARLCNIEAKNSWKTGDREVVAQVINELEGDAEPSTSDQKSEASGRSDVDGSQTRDAGDPFAASKRFLDDVREEYGARHAAADALPPVPVWCDDGESEADDDLLVAVEPVRTKRIVTDDSGIDWVVPENATPAEVAANVGPDAAMTMRTVPVEPAAPAFTHADGTPCHGCQICLGNALDDAYGRTITAHNITISPIGEIDGKPVTLNGTATVMIDWSDSDDLDDVPSLVDLLGDTGETTFDVSNSLVQTAKRCKRKWWLGWYRGLAPKNENLLDTRSTGTRVHRALQAWYVPDGEVQTDPRDALERVLVEDWTKIKTAAEERGHDEFVIGDLSTRFEKAASLERAMVEGYVEWLQETGADSQLKIVGAEQQMRVHLYDHVRADGEIVPVHAIGLLDVRAYRTSDGAKLFMDHKTVGDLKSPVALLPQNEQMLHYHLLEWLSTSDAEERCDGALYNMLRRVKRTARATPPFYDRYEVRHNTHELETYRRRLISETRDILHMVERLDAGADPMDVAYPTPTKNCTWDCDFFSICSMFDDGSRVEDAVASLYTTVDPNARYEPTKGNE